MGLKDCELFRSCRLHHLCVQLFAAHVVIERDVIVVCDMLDVVIAYVRIAVVVDYTAFVKVFSEAAQDCLTKFRWGYI